MPIFHNSELLTLADIHNLQTVFFVYECIDGLLLSYYCDYFETLSSTHAIGTRQATIGSLFLQRHNTDPYGIRSMKLLRNEINEITAEYGILFQLKENHLPLL